MGLNGLVVLVVAKELVCVNPEIFCLIDGDCDSYIKLKCIIFVCELKYVFESN